MQALDNFLTETDASLVIYRHHDQFVCSSHWGREAPDSPMTGAAAYGMAATVTEALDHLLKEARF